MSWWRHIEEEIPKLAEQGYTQIWLPPPNKAAELVSAREPQAEIHTDSSYRMDVATMLMIW